MQISASRRDRTGIRSGRVGRLQQGLDPIGGTRLARADLGLCHLRNNSEKWYYIKISESITPTRAKRQLIVLAASPLNRESSDTERRFTLYHIDDSPEAFRRNTIIVINTTGAELYGRVADSQINLPRGHSSPIPYTPGKSDNATSITFALETKKGAKLVMSNDLKIPDNRRVLLVLEPPRRPGSLRIAVRMLSESIFLEDEETTLN